MPFRRWMWADALDLMARAERLQRQFFQRAVYPSGPRWEPPLDVLETDDGLLLVVALPGVPPDQIRISVDSRSLHIAGERPWPSGSCTTAIHRLEIPHGPFERWIELPDGFFALEHKELAHGCLTLFLRRIEV